MAGNPFRPESARPPKSSGDRMPTNEELLHELRKHGAPPTARPPPPSISRRTRDYLLLAGLGSAVIGFAFKLVSSSDPGNGFKLALTGIALFCGLLWFIFYGVMSRY